MQLPKNSVGRKFQLGNGELLDIFSPQNDDTVLGTAAAISEGSFCLDRVRFEEGDVFLDLGCNIGLLSCLVAKLNPKAMVYGFDASPIAVEFARINACANGLTNAVFFQKAIKANRTGPQKFYSNGKEVSCLIEEKFRQDFSDSYVCESVTLADILLDPLLSIQKVKLLKSDIEGSEFEVFYSILESSPDLLDRVDCFHIEIHKMEGEDHQKLTNLLKLRLGARFLNP